MIGVTGVKGLRIQLIVRPTGHMPEPEPQPEPYTKPEGSLNRLLFNLWLVFD